MMVKWSFRVNPGWRWGSPAWLTYTSIYPGRKGTIWSQLKETGMTSRLRIPQLHTTGQPKPPEGHCWVVGVDVGVGIFFHPTLKFLSRQSRLKQRNEQTKQCGGLAVVLRSRRKCLSRWAQDRSHPISVDDLFSVLFTLSPLATFWKARVSCMQFTGKY